MNNILSTKPVKVVKQLSNESSCPNLYTINFHLKYKKKRIIKPQTFNSQWKVKYWYRLFEKHTLVSDVKG